MSTISSGTTSTTTLVHSGDTTGSLVFKTNDTGSGGTTAMTIDTSQKVGIGTSSPTQPLQINMTTGDQGIKLQAHNTTAGNRLSFADSSGTEYGLVNYDHGSDYMSFYTNSSERMRIDSSGNLLVGTTSVGGTGWSSYPTGYAITNGANSTFTHISFQTSSAQKGYIQTVGSTTNYNGSSDYRLKENVEPISNALATVGQLKPVKFNWKEDGTVGYSFIAHELQEVMPQAVGGVKDEVDADGKPVYQGIDPSKLVATLVASIQELKAIVDAQAVTLATQATEIAQLKAKVGA